MSNACESSVIIIERWGYWKSYSYQAVIINKSILFNAYVMPVLETKTGLYMTCNLTLFINVISIIVFIVYAGYVYVALKKCLRK